MQVAGVCFASSQKYYHGVVTILKINLMIFLGFGIYRFGNLFLPATLLYVSHPAIAPSHI